MRLVLVLVSTLVAYPAFAQDASQPLQWRNWLVEIVKDIEGAVKTGNADLFERRMRRPIDFLASAKALPEEHNVRLHCTFTAQYAANYASSLRSGKFEAAAIDLKDYRRHDQQCAKSARAFDRAPTAAIKAPPLPEAPPLPANERSPSKWLAEVEMDAVSARDAARTGKINMNVLSAIARSAPYYRARIADWKPSPKNSDAYGICGDLVIALASVDKKPRDAFETYDRLLPSCKAAIGR